MRKTILFAVFSAFGACLISPVGKVHAADIWPKVAVNSADATIGKGEPKTEASNKLIIAFPELDCRAGSVMIAVYSESNGFLSEKAFVERAVKCSELSDNKVELNLPPGRIAVAAYHDSNGNKKLDRNFVSYPTEPFGFSNNPKCVTGPPKFDQAAFNLSSDMEIRIVLK